MLYIVGSAVKRAGRSGRAQPKHDADLARIDLDAFDQGPHELAACLPIDLLQPPVHPERELLELPDEYP
jgi:hypothetical protein